MATLYLVVVCLVTPVYASLQGAVPSVLMTETYLLSRIEGLLQLRSMGVLRLRLSKVAGQEGLPGVTL